MHGRKTAETVPVRLMHAGRRRTGQEGAGVGGDVAAGRPQGGKKTGSRRTDERDDEAATMQAGRPPEKRARADAFSTFAGLALNGQ